MARDPGVGGASVPSGTNFLPSTLTGTTTASKPASSSPAPNTGLNLPDSNGADYLASTLPPSHPQYKKPAGEKAGSSADQTAKGLEGLMLPGGLSRAVAVLGPRRYNATLHPYSRPVLNNSGSRGAGPRPYSTGEIVAVFEQGSLKTDAEISKWYARKTNWAFRFLYNPANFRVSTQINAAATPTLIDPARFFGQQQAIGFQLYLNRTAELNHGIQNVDYREILAAGTQYDVNYLYKVVNGDAGDVGFLVNTLVRIVFGPSIFYEGFITNIDVQHTHFNARMTPMQSLVDITMTRVTQNKNPAGEEGQ